MDAKVEVMRQFKYSGHNDFIPYLMNKAVDALNADFQHFLHQKKLTLTHWRTLAFLSKKEDRFSLSSLSRLTALDKATLSRAVNSLERNGYIDISYSPLDKRLKLIQITEAGQQMFGEILPYACRYSEQALANINDEELALFKAVLIKIYGNSID